MSKAPLPGAARGDRVLYSGRTRLGTIRSTAGGILGFDASGRLLGAFPDERAAKDAISARSREASR